MPPQLSVAPGDERRVHVACLPRLEGDLDLLGISTLVEDGQSELFVRLVELVSGCAAIGLSRVSCPRNVASTWTHLRVVIFVPV